MNFRYHLIVVDGDARNNYRGPITGADPRDAVANVLRTETDWLEDFGSALQPTVTISRDANGDYVAEIDSHGLGVADLTLVKE